MSGTLTHPLTQHYTRGARHLLLLILRRDRATTDITTRFVTAEFVISNMTLRSRSARHLLLLVLRRDRATTHTGPRFVTAEFVMSHILMQAVGMAVRPNLKPRSARHLLLLSLRRDSFQSPSATAHTGTQFVTAERVMSHILMQAVAVAVGMVGMVGMAVRPNLKPRSARHLLLLSLRREIFQHPSATAHTGTQFVTAECVMSHILMQAVGVVVGMVGMAVRLTVVRPMVIADLTPTSESQAIHSRPISISNTYPACYEEYGPEVHEEGNHSLERRCVKI